MSDAVDVLPAVVSERLLDRSKFPQGTEVSINGQIRSYNNYIAADQKNKLLLTLFVRELISENKIKEQIIDQDQNKDQGQESIQESNQELNQENDPDQNHINNQILDSSYNQYFPPTKHKNPNDVYLNGYICRPPIYRTTPLGREIADILIAVNRAYNKSDYIPCIAWGRNARYAGKFKISDKVMVWGRLQSRKYQKKQEDGETTEKTAYEISISKLEHADKSTETAIDTETHE